MNFIWLVFTGLFNFVVLNKKNQSVNKSLPLIPSLPVGYKKFKFQCWLCEGETDFGVRPLIKQKIFNIECCRCGVENNVRVKPFN